MAPITSIEPSQITVIQSIHSSESSQVFSVEYGGVKCCLKVFHPSPDAELIFNERDFCRYRSEIKAYQNLQKYGVCDRGHVPHCYGFLERLDPTLFAPYLNSFLSDRKHPNAIVLEYLSDTQQLHCRNYSEERMDKAMAGIDDIHSAYVEHNDPYPKNILIVQGSPERVVWIDFDVALTYKVENMTLAKKEGLDYEAEVVKSFGTLLKKDQEQGLPPNTKFY